MLKRHALTLANALLLCVSLDAAGAGYPKTEAEFARLPPYCRARMGDNNTAAYQKWQGVFGQKNFIHMHHYCAALNDVNSARAAVGDADKQQRALEAAVKNFAYMERMTQADFFLRPEISVQKGKALALLGRTQEAASHFNAAIARKADYTPAYAALSDLLRDSGDTTQAIEVLRRGLDAKPGSTALAKRLRRLTGD